VNISSDFAIKYPIRSSTFATVDLKGATPRQHISGHYATYTGSGSPISIAIRRIDLYPLPPNIGFSAPANVTSYARIDFILGGSNGGWFVPFMFTSHLGVAFLVNWIQAIEVIPSGELLV
jgi:hypothetical protein